MTVVAVRGAADFWLGEANGLNLNRMHAHTHVGGSRKNRTFLPPSNARALYVIRHFEGRYPRRTSFATNSQSKSNRSDDEVDALDALRAEHLVHGERVAKVVPYVTLNMQRNTQ